MLKPAISRTAFVLLMSIGVTAASAARLPCAPCTGVHVEDLSHALAEINRFGGLDAESPFWIAWTASLDGTAETDRISAVQGVGANPWLRVVFRTPPPLADHLEQLEFELAELTTLIQGSPENLTVQAVWLPSEGVPEPKDHAFLLKRAAVAVTGATEGASFAAGPFGPDLDYLRALYDEEVAAYLDAVAIEPGFDSAAFSVTLTELDPGKPIVLDSVDWPSRAAESAALAAEASSNGVALTLFNTVHAKSPELDPLLALARDFSGDLSFAPGSAPLGAYRSWAFVRGEDLGLRVIAETDPQLPQVQLIFGDDTLRDPEKVDLSTGSSSTISRQHRSGGRLTVTVDDPGAFAMLKLNRATAAELQGFDDQIDVDAERQMPVEEILRRLQAFEDDQARRLDHYEATNTLHLRFRGATGSIEASYDGAFFYRRDAGFDWVWENFYFGGVKWRSKKLPELPLIQPEKVSSLPTQIRFTKDYEYRLRGEATLEGRDCWVVDFEPFEPQPEQTLYQGTVWVDKQVYARVKTRALQIGLAGDVISNEEISYFTPFDGQGQLADWDRMSYVLPARIVGQQIFSVLSATLPVERETVLTDIVINGANFDSNREAALASEFTMVRDTDVGLRYLRKDDSGQRVVDNELDTNRLLLVGGVFWDESLDYPLPLAGVNYLDLDYKDTGRQLNILFAGAYLNASLSDPDVFGSKWNAGINLSSFFIKRGDELYRDGAEVPEEEIESRDHAAAFYLGRPLTPFLKLDLTYRVRHNSYDTADDTADEFILPSDHFIHTFETELIYSRSGYRFGLTGSVNRRSEWDFWGLPGNQEFSKDHEEYKRWRAVLAKTFWFDNYKKLGVALEYVGGEDLDRFSGIDFGLFGDTSVAGYQSGLVRAEEASGIHLDYGLNVHDIIRFEIEGDAVWASNDATGLDNELLAGIGIEGTLTLPWQMATNFEIGYALEGPGKGDFAARIVFLKLFGGS